MKLLASCSPDTDVPRVLLSSNPLKRKEPPDDREDKSFSPSTSLPAGATLPRGEYETGRVICEVCENGVPIRDEGTGGFTVKHWDAHRLTW